jgi:hypothetical protein
MFRIILKIVAVVVGGNVVAGVSNEILDVAISRTSSNRREKRKGLGLAVSAISLCVAVVGCGGSALYLVSRLACHKDEGTASIQTSDRSLEVDEQEHSSSSWLDEWTRALASIPLRKIQSPVVLNANRVKPRPARKASRMKNLSCIAEEDCKGTDESDTNEDDTPLGIRDDGGDFERREGF